MLSVTGLKASYGAIRAVSGIDIEVAKGAFVAILGANGAGKSTTLRSIAGIHRPITGAIRLEGEEIGRLRLHQVVAPLSVEDNLRLSAFAGRGNQAALLARVYDLFPRLAERRWQTAGLMSGGEQQMLAIGRALMTAPAMLVLDEPSMGLAPAIVDIVFDAIVALHKSGQSILLVEQNAAIALSVCDDAYVMKRGVIVAHGTPDSLRNSAEIAEAYLG